MTDYTEALHFSNWIMVMQDGLFHYEPNHFQENIMLSHFLLFPGKQNRRFSEKEFMRFSLSFILFSLYGNHLR